MQFNLDRKNHQNAMNLQTPTPSCKFQRPAPATQAARPNLFPVPALDGPSASQDGDPYDEWNATWKGREAVVAYCAFPAAFTRGVVEELKRRNTPLLSALTTFNNRILRAIRASRRTRHQVEAPTS